VTKSCFNCGKKGKNLYGYIICDSCKSRLGLFKDETIEKYASKNPEKFSKDIDYRLDFIEKDFKKKRIKLLYIQEQLKHLKQSKKV